MATYKVIQDIEAEDKLLGPLTLRQFIYAIIVVVSAFIAFRLATIQWFLVLPFIPPIIFFTVLAAPFGHDQPSEVWLLAKVRFFLKPRRRIWNQSGIKELVTITVPQRVEKSLTKDLSQVEVRSRLRALADTIDSRGWAVKNINVNLFSEPSYVVAAESSDRLLAPSNLPQDVPVYDVQATDDIMDENSNPTAQYLSQMIAASTATHKQQAIKQMRQPPKDPQQTQADYWFLNEPLNAGTVDPGYATFTASKVVKPGQENISTNAPQATLPAPEEQALLEQLHAEEMQAATTPIFSHAKTLRPLDDANDSDNSQQPSPFSVAVPQPPAPKPLAANQPIDNTVTAVPNTAIIELANNDDLNVATIQRQAEKASRKKPPADEVVITLR